MPHPQKNLKEQTLQLIFSHWKWYKRLDNIDVSDQSYKCFTRIIYGCSKVNFCSHSSGYATLFATEVNQEHRSLKKLAENVYYNQTF